jgi:hypothetical protein
MVQRAAAVVTTKSASYRVKRGGAKEQAFKDGQQRRKPAVDTMKGQGND